jgi:hypothetical protein
MLCLALLAFPVLAQESVEGDERELALREDPWTHLVVTLTSGKKVTFTRAEIGKVQYVTRRDAGTGGSDGWMGRVWRMRESAPDGRYCDGVWTRQGTTNRFAGQWTCSWGARVSDTLVVQPLRGRSFVVFREGVREDYRGTLGADGRTISGTTWAAGGVWSGKIE